MQARLLAGAMAFALHFSSYAATAQVSYPPPNTATLATRGDLDELQTAMMAAMPQPASTIGPVEVVGGSAGSASTYKRGDWVPVRISRTGSCVLTASANCTIAWSTPFPSGVAPVMLGDPVAVNTSAGQPIDCDIVSLPTTTSVAVKCWVAQTTVLSPSLLTTGVTVLPFVTTSMTGTMVTASAIPASQ